MQSEDTNLITKVEGIVCIIKKQITEQKQFPTGFISANYNCNW